MSNCPRCGRAYGNPILHEFCHPATPRSPKPSKAAVQTKDYIDYVMESAKHYTNILKRFGAPKTAKPPIEARKYDIFHIRRKRNQKPWK